MRIVSIVGARPQFIKAAMVSPLIRAAGVREVLIHTGQHYDASMSEVFFEELEIPAPDYHLKIGSAGHGAQTGRMLEAIERALLKERPEKVIVYGDTNTTLAGALAASKLNIPVAHVEAGLRSFNRRMPEEINRVVTDHLSALLFVPTATATRNLQGEGIREGIHEVGDVMFDAALQHAKLARTKSKALQAVGVLPKKYALATVHRAENTDQTQRLTAIFEALQILAQSLPVVLPLHPRTRKALASSGATANPGLIVTDPVPYLDMLHLEFEAQVVLTDSGGVQKEAFFFHVPCITLRDETEWTETVETGWNTLVGANTSRIVDAALASTPGNKDACPFGTGEASRKICDILTSP